MAWAKNLWQPAGTIVLSRARPEEGPDAASLGEGPVLAHGGTTSPVLDQSIHKAAEMLRLKLQLRTGFDSPMMRAFEEPGREVLSLAVPVLFGDTPGEAIDLKDLENLSRLLAACIREGVDR